MFLGFAYHDQNLALLKPRTPVERKMFVGTAYGMSDSDEEVVVNQLAGFMDDSLEPEGKATYLKINNDLICSQLFDYFAKSIAA